MNKFHKGIRSALIIEIAIFIILLISWRIAKADDENDWNDMAAPDTMVCMNFTNYENYNTYTWGPEIKISTTPGNISGLISGDGYMILTSEGYNIIVGGP